MNPDGSETITPKTVGKAPIDPIVTPAPTRAPGKGPLLEAFDRQQQEINWEGDWLEEYFKSEEGQRVIDEIIRVNNANELIEFKGEQAPYRPVKFSDNSKAGPSGKGVKNKGVKRLKTTDTRPKAQVERPETTTMVSTRSGSQPTGASLPGTGGEMGGMEVDGVASNANVSGNRGFDGGFSMSLGPEINVDRPMSFRQGGTMKFKKVHDFFSWGVPHTPLKHGGTDPGLSLSDLFMVTPLLRIPWEYPVLYMTPTEFDLLPEGSYAISASIKIVERNARVAFETNSSTSGLATLNQNKFGVFCNDLLSRAPVVNKKVTFDGANPMKPSSITTPNINDLTEIIWGNDQSVAGFDSKIPSGVFRIPINWTEYACVHTTAESAAGSLSENVGWAMNYANAIQFYQMSPETAGTEVYSDHYKFVCAPLKKVKKAFLPFVAANVEYPRGAAPLRPSKTDFLNPQDEVTNSISHAFQGASVVIPDSEVGYDRLLEKPNIWKGSKPCNPARQNSCHVGIRAVPKLTTDSNATIASEFTDVQAWWEVTVELEVGYDLHHMYTYGENYVVDSENAMRITTGKDTNPPINVPLFLRQYPSDVTR